MADRSEASRKPITKRHAMNILDGIASGVVVGILTRHGMFDVATAKRILWYQIKQQNKAREKARAAK